MPLVVSRSQLIGWCILAALGILPMAGVVPLYVWWGLSALLLVGALLDGVVALFLRLPTVSRTLPRSLSLGVMHEVELEARNEGTGTLKVHLFDRVPDTVRYLDLPKTVQLGPEEGAKLVYRAEPTSRGPMVFDGVDARMESPLGLWWRQKTVPIRDEVRVYPNFRAVARYALLATENRLSLLGIKKRQRRGMGTEFQELRDYQPGDPLRSIDWRATARVRRV
ncbi:MAG: DUF58 domain-containing protein, partial [Myxococcota bacterium]